RLSFYLSSLPPPSLLPFPTRRSSDLADPARSAKAQRRLRRCHRRSARAAFVAESPPDSIAREPPVPPIVSHTSSRGNGGTSAGRDRKSTRLNSSHEWISYAVFCLKKK